MKSLSFICPLSLIFVKIGSLVFPDIVHGDSWPWYLVTDEAKFLEKNLAARIRVMNEPKSGPKLRF